MIIKIAYSELVLTLNNLQVASKLTEIPTLIISDEENSWLTFQPF